MGSTAVPDTDRLYSLITALSRSVGASTSSSARGVDGVATASVAMLSKMISKYDMTKVRSIMIRAHWRAFSAARRAVMERVCGQQAGGAGRQCGGAGVRQALKP